MPAEIRTCYLMREKGGNYICDFIRKIEDTLQKYRMLDLNDKVLVAVSGGADSLALLYVLKELQVKYKFEIEVVCIDHMFRGEESKEEALYVQELSTSLGLKSHIYERNVPEIIRKTGLSPEDAGHKMRHEIFKQLREEHSFTKLALGHHAEDRAETVLMHLVQGTGLQGLAAMPPVFNWLIRPLAEVNKAEIISFCQDKGIEYHQDPTNEEKLYLRNKIRLELLPYLQKELNPNIIDALLRLENIVEADNDFLENCSLEKRKELVLKKETDNIEKQIDNIEKQTENIIIDLEKFRGLHLALKRRLLRDLYQELKPQTQGLSFQHVENLIELATNEAGAKSINLPEGLIVKKTYTSLIFAPEKALSDMKVEKKEQEEIRLNIPGKTILPGENIIIEAHYVDEMIKLKGYNEVLVDADKIHANLIVRKRKAGDRIKPLGMKGRKKLKDFLIDRKIEQEKRDQLNLVCQNDDIIWIPGLVLSQNVRVTAETKKYLLLQSKAKE